MDGAIRAMLAVARAAHSDEPRCEAGYVLETLAAEAATHATVTVECERPTAPLWLAAPQGLVIAALSPLVENATRHAVHNVSLGAARSGRRVVLTVTDDGPGVTAEDLPRIFQPGHSNSGHDGAGLGLALSRRLATSVGGEVRARPVGHGLFELELPEV